MPPSGVEAFPGVRTPGYILSPFGLGSRAYGHCPKLLIEDQHSFSRQAAGRHKGDRCILQEIDRQRLETKKDSAARKEAVEAFDRDYMAVGQMAEAFLRSAGLDAQADRIHPSTRQLDRKSDEEAVDGRA